MPTAQKPLSHICLCVLLFFLAASPGCSKKDLGPTEPATPPPDTAPPTVSIISPLTNEVCWGVDTVFINAVDNIRVDSVQLYFDGVKGYTSTSTPPVVLIWNTASVSDGVHSLHAKAFDPSGNVGTSPTVAIEVRNQVRVVFTNPVYTPISVTLAGTTKTFSPGDSAVFSVSRTLSSVSWTAQTSGATTTGSRVGLLVTWSATSDLTGLSTKRINLVVTSSYFFIYVTTDTPLGPFYVNYGLTDATVDNIVIAGDSKPYMTGYYPAHSNTQIRATKVNSPSYYIYWNQGVHFTLPGTTNQNVSLLHTGGLFSMHAGVAESTTTAYSGAAGGILYPARSVRVRMISDPWNNVVSNTGN